MLQKSYNKRRWYDVALDESNPIELKTFLDSCQWESETLGCRVYAAQMNADIRVILDIFHHRDCVTNDN
jgi:hypothetical protein